MNSLYDDADFYDLVAPRDADMEHFYVETADGTGRRVKAKFSTSLGRNSRL